MMDRVCPTEVLNATSISLTATMLLPVSNCKKPANLLSFSDLMNRFRWSKHARSASGLGWSFRNLTTRFVLGFFSPYIVYRLETSQNSGKNFRACNSSLQAVAIYFGFWTNSWCANSSIMTLIFSCVG